MSNRHFSCFSSQHDFLSQAQELGIAYSIAALTWQERRLRSLPAASLPPVNEYFRLLDLPPEIRNMIYELVVPTTSTTAQNENQPPRCLLIPRNSAVRVPSLCQTNRQIRNESLPMYFAFNHFRLWVHDMPTLSAALHWLDTGLNATKASLIQRFDICIGSVLFIEFGLGAGGIYTSSIRFSPHPEFELEEITDRQYSIRPGILSVLNSMKTATPADSGLRVHHIARVLRAVFEDYADLTYNLRMRMNQLCVCRA